MDPRATAPTDGDVRESDLLAAVIDLDRHVGADGWDQPALIYALVPAATITATAPQLAGQLGLLGPDAPGPTALMTFEQPAPPADRELDEFLAGISWPEEIAAAVVVVERIVLPPSAEVDLDRAGDPLAAAREHPDRRDVRLLVAVSRAGVRMCAIRMRPQGSDPEDPRDLRTGPDLVPGLAEALAATFHA